MLEIVIVICSHNMDEKMQSHGNDADELRPQVHLKQRDDLRKTFNKALL